MAFHASIREKSLWQNVSKTLERISSMKIGKLLWWDRIDQNGIIEDFTGCRFYVDVSVVDNETINLLNHGRILYFEVNESVRTSPCAYRVSHLPPQLKNSSQGINQCKNQSTLWTEEK